MAAERTVYLGTNDISRWVIDLPNVQLRAGEYGQVATNPIPFLPGADQTGFWNSRCAASPFYGMTRPADFPIRIEIAGLTVFTGSIQGITSDGYKADVSLRTILQRTLEGGLIYESPAVPLDPASTFAAICVQYGIPFDSVSVATSAAIYTAAGLAVQVSQPSPAVKILDAFQALAEVGVARIYEVLGTVYFEAWQPRTAVALSTFTDTVGVDTLWDRPTVQTVEKDACEGYVVEWIGSPTHVRGLSNAIRRTISAGPGATVMITSDNGAVWVGEQWFRYLNTPQDMITFRVPAAIGRSLVIGAAVEIDYSRWAAPVTVDVQALDLGSDLYTTLTCLTR